LPDLNFSLEETSICAVDISEIVLRKGWFLSCAQAITSFIEAPRLVLERIRFEAGQLAPWLYFGAEGRINGNLR
jgi:hypothetical protein